jgi:hypothetical protein
LERDHIRSPKLGPACQRVSYGFRKEYETMLRAVLERNRHKDVQGQACVGLAHFLSSRMQRLDLIREQPALAKEFEDLFGKGYLDQMRRQDRTMAEREAEGLFERAIAHYGAVKLAEGVTVGDKAKAGLFEIRNLVIGKTAPDIEGEDQDGRRFQLSDYRGKVVLLDFWSEA